VSGKAISSTSVERLGFATGLGMLAAAALIALVEPLSQLFRLIPRNYNEGWNAFWAEAATHGNPLYVAPDSPIANNYPPLSFHLVGLIGRAIGDNVIAGRLVSLASFVVILGAAYLFLRETGSARRIALAGAVILCVTFAFFGQTYVAVNDPQMLAHAFMLAGLSVLFGFNFSRSAVIAGAVLVLLGGFTKHLLIPLPIALTLWIAMYRREHLLAWLACFAIGLPLGFWWISSAYPPFIAELLSQRAYSAHQSVSSAIHALVRFLPLIALGACSLRLGQRLTPRVALVLMYAVLSLGVGALAAGGEGVTRNAYFDLLIAVTLLAAFGLESMLETARSRVVAVMGVGVLAFAVTTVPETVRDLRELDALERDTRATVAMIQQLGQGHAACETLSLCYWARDPFTLDFFNYGRKLRTGSASLDVCEKALQSGAFPVLQLEYGRRRSPAGERLWPCTPAIHQYYTEAFRSRAGILLVPKERLSRS
jgi:uncharacterized membrane protein